MKYQPKHLPTRKRMCTKGYGMKARAAIVAGTMALALVPSTAIAAEMPTMEGGQDYAPTFEEGFVERGEYGQERQFAPGMGNGPRMQFMGEGFDQQMDPSAMPEMPNDGWQNEGQRPEFGWHDGQAPDFGQPMDENAPTPPSNESGQHVQDASQLPERPQRTDDGNEPPAKPDGEQQGTEGEPPQGNQAQGRPSENGTMRAGQQGPDNSGRMKSFIQGFVKMLGIEIDETKIDEFLSSMQPQQGQQPGQQSQTTSAQTQQG